MATQETAPAPERPVERSAPTFSDLFGRITRNVEQVIQGKPEVIELALVVLVAEGHLLIEDVPGVGKTSMAKALAASIDCTWGRVQFTPDLLPSDVVGVTVWNRGTSEFEFRPGPIFANIVLGDEINRASPKTQSALLEAMEERQVTVDGTTYPLEAPFMVIATQNPIDHEGTYPLPESQLDRFLLQSRCRVSRSKCRARDPRRSCRPQHARGAAAGRHRRGRAGHGQRGASRPRRTEPQGLSRRPRRGEQKASRSGAGHVARATLSLQRASRAMAAANGRNYVLPDDVKALAGPVLAHRLMLTPEAQMQGADAGRASWPTSSQASLSLRVARLEPVITRTGWAALGAAAALVVCGRVFGIFELYVIGAGIAALVVIALIAVRATRLRLEVAREVIPAKVHAGSDARVEVRSTNLARWRSPLLRLRDPVSGTRGALLHLAPLAPGGRARAAYRLPTAKRGVIAIGPLTVQITDPFGLTSVTTAAAAATDLTVYPKLDTIRPLHQTHGRDPHAAPSTPTRSASSARTSTRCVPTSSATTSVGCTGLRPPATTTSWCARTSSPGRAARACCSTSAAPRTRLRASSSRSPRRRAS